MSRSNGAQETLITTPIFGGMLRKPKIYGIPTDAWLILIVLGGAIFINIGISYSVMTFLVGYVIIYLLCLYDADIFDVLLVNAQFLETPARKKMGCDVYVPF